MLFLVFPFRNEMQFGMQLFITTLEVISWKSLQILVYSYWSNQRNPGGIVKQKKAFRNPEFGTFITDQAFASNQNWSREK